MWTYQAPLRDLQFVIEELLDAPARWREIPAFAELDADTARQILAEAGRFAAEVLAPTNATGDVQGCTWDPQNGQVRTPDGFASAYRSFCDGGWPALACDPQWGGQGLPQLLNMALHEMLNSANHAWTMYPGLSHGAYEALKAHATPELQQRYLPPIVSGEWLATMCLTESHAGSDLGLLRTRAEPLGTELDNGAPVRVTGTKIFISGGDHDLSDNIVHLVLARLPDAPAGSKGLSVVLVPKLLPDGQPNAVRCDGIEKKMGIKGSATCVLSFEGATGWLIGEAHRGLAVMFMMMNAARLQVGMQGLGHLEAARQNALRHAHERTQSRAPARPDGPAASGPDAIALHPAVRRTLWTLEALTQGQRLLALWTAQLLDQAEHHPEPALRSRAANLTALLTPIVKSFLTANGHHGANAALQVWGGHGYVHDFGIEQTVRDSRIAMIYEGTNEIQAIDLLQRKVFEDGGHRLALLLDELDREVRACAGTPSIAALAAPLRQAIDALREATARLYIGRRQDAEWPFRVADDYLRAAGLVLMGWAWARRARACESRTDDPWHADQLAAARFGIEWLLPEAAWLLRRVQDSALALPWAPGA